MLLCAALACALARGLAAQNSAGPAAPAQSGDELRALIESTRNNAIPVPPASSRNPLNTDRAAFSDPKKRGTLKITDAIHRAEIQGVADNEISASSPLALKTQDGPGAPAGFELVEKNNVITLNVSGDTKESYKFDFKIRVPRDTNIIIEDNSMAGPGYVAIADIDGDVDISKKDGSIIFKNTTGAITANAYFGSIVAVLGKAPEKPVVLANMLGNISLALPAATAASVRMRTGSRGGIRTNFPEDALKITTNTTSPENRFGSNAQADIELLDALKEEITKRQRARATGAASTTPAISVLGGKIIAGGLNGGGVDIMLTANSGTITLRQSK